MIKSNSEIYKVLEDMLRASGENPQTCVDLYDNPSVKTLVDSPNRVSDYLGHMWRRGIVKRWYAPKGSHNRSQYAYTWIEVKDDAPKPIERLSLVQNQKPIATKGNKPHVEILEEEGAITLDFKEFTITVRRK